jgi:hypothetical protein
MSSQGQYRHFASKVIDSDTLTFNEVDVTVFDQYGSTVGSGWSAFQFETTGFGYWVAFANANYCAASKASQAGAGNAWDEARLWLFTTSGPFYHLTAVVEITYDIAYITGAPWCTE